MNPTVTSAIFKRDFISYFSNPTGYVFICVFVILSSMATFVPPAFFNNNLANLDQLSTWMPWILLVFIPAITMSSWSEERRQGTDELLLTIPASDFDVVIGKYLSCAAIFTVSLLFSMFSIWIVFSWGLGSPDMGLFLCTYLGYWFLGLAMLSIGMVASFLTKNLTVGFVFGMLLNAPLAAFSIADWFVKDPKYAQMISRWSADAQLADFERGVISLSGVSYFLSLMVVMLYVCMVLIGKRHWGTGDDGDSRWAHYFGRAIALVVIFGGLNVFISNYNSLRADITTERINSLSESTITLLDELRNNDEVDTILVDAYVSPTVPSEYAAHKLNLLGTLQELQSMSGGKIHVSVYQIENFSEQAATAETRFNIVPQPVITSTRGVNSQEEIFMGVAVRHKLDKVVVPFIDKGIPVEYELVRSILTVAQDTRKRVGVVKTDVQLFSSFSMQGATEESQLITELRKQYEVVEVDPEEPIVGDYDVLLAVQPSAMSPQAMDNLVDAVKGGMPVAVFEDPMPMPWAWDVPGTSEDRTMGGPMAMFGGGQTLPKGDIQKLYSLLGLEIDPEQVVLQKYNPYPQYPFPEFFVFIDEGLEAYGTPQPFNLNQPISSGFKQLLTIAPGHLRKDETTKLTYSPLLVTGNLTAEVPFSVVGRMNNIVDMVNQQKLSKESFTVGALIEGEYEDTDDLMGDLAEQAAAEEDEEETPKLDETGKPIEKTPIKAVVITDIDWLFDEFFRIRSQGEQNITNLPDMKFQNVSFVLNVLDYLAGDDRFLDIRKRSRSHRVLTLIEKATYEARKESRETIDEAQTEMEEAIEQAQQKFQGKLDAIRQRNDLSPQEMEVMIRRVEVTENRKLERQISQLRKDFQRTQLQTQRQLDREVRGVQDRYKTYAWILPPILPILLGVLVYFHRRGGEREGVSKTRLRYNQREE
ncbi:Gldg family protein [Aeoliella mucimassa]|uniref:ABC-type uncharacterized transport system n=1 Tax=Aeoliella mucimassa TaxID=2527972 RepID=A0A518AI49_9BACT|nr:Gldg family protein [Aeoliella mucimassa]QDU54396.1 ABC-type uncharacterized transport system [Aeoliella mucimassa]